MTPSLVKSGTAIGALALLASCSTVDEAAPAKTVTVTEMAEAIEDSDPSSTTSTTTSKTPTTTTTTTEPPTSTSSSSGPPVVGPQVSKLTLGNAFDSEDWESVEDQWPGQPASRAVWRTSNYVGRSTKYLRFRVNGATGTLSLQLAQGIQTECIAHQAKFTLKADGNEVGTKTIDFKEQDSLEVDLAGKNDILLEVKSLRPKGNDCYGKIYPLVTKAEIVAQ